MAVAVHCRQMTKLSDQIWYHSPPSGSVSSGTPGTKVIRVSKALSQLQPAWKNLTNTQIYKNINTQILNQQSTFAVTASLAKLNKYTNTNSLKDTIGQLDVNNDNEKINF